MKVLITGGAGFIGSHLANELFKLCEDIIVVDNLSSGKKENLNSKINFFKEDVTSSSFLRFLKKVNPDIIYHFAAQSSISKSNKNPKDDFKINLLATQDLLQISAKIKVKKIIFASSAAVYGETKKLPIVESTPKTPTSIYGLTKLTSEYLFKINFNNFKIPYTCLRFANVFGENQNNSSEGGVVAIFIDRILNNKVVTIHGDGNQTRDFIYVADVTRANIGALNKNLIGEFNVSTGKETSINELYSALVKISTIKVQKNFTPSPFVEVTRSVLSPNKLESQTKWKQRVNLEQGLKSTYKFFKNK